MSITAEATLVVKGGGWHTEEICLLWAKQQSNKLLEELPAKSVYGLDNLALTVNGKFAAIDVTKEGYLLMPKTI